MTTEILHKEMTGLRWLAMSLAAGVLVSLCVAIATGFPWRGGLVLLASVGLLLANAIWEIYRLNRIVLTPERLVVGREVFEPADIDIIFGVQPPLVLRPGEQHRVENETPLPPGSDVRIAGGSYGRRVGTAMVVLRDARTGQIVAVFSRTPEVLSRRLTTWLTDVPDTPVELIEPEEPTED